MTNVHRRILYTAAVALLCVFGFFTLWGPQGISALMEKRSLIRQLETENADLAQQNENKRRRIDNLGRNESKQKLEIREKTKKILPGETEFVLPETPRPATAAKDPITAQ